MHIQLQHEYDLHLGSLTLAAYFVSDRAQSSDTLPYTSGTILEEIVFRKAQLRPKRKKEKGKKKHQLVFSQKIKTPRRRMMGVQYLFLFFSLVVQELDSKLRLGALVIIIAVRHEY